MFSSPAYNIEQFDLQSGSRVADFGAGSGFYTLVLAKAIGDRGKVYAIEVQKNILETLRGEAVKRGLRNIEFIWGNIEKIGGSRLKENFLDAVVIANVFFQSADKKKIVAEAVRILKPGGKVLVIDWTDSYGGLGPSEESVVSELEIKNLFESAGCVFRKQISAGDHHFGIILVKK